VQRVEDPELLDDRQRRVVPHLHRARPDPDRRRRRRDQGDHERRRRAGHARVEVVLGQPVAGVAGVLGALSQIDAAPEGLACVRAGGDGNEVEDRERGLGSAHGG